MCYRGAKTGYDFGRVMARLEAASPSKQQPYRKFSRSLSVHLPPGVHPGIQLDLAESGLIAGDVLLEQS